MKSFKINDREDDFIYELILGIINQACIDWHWLSTSGRFRADSHAFNEKYNEVSTYKRCRDDLISFFESDWAEVLFKAVNINNRYVLRLLKENCPLPEQFIKDSNKKRFLYKRKNRQFG